MKAEIVISLRFLFLYSFLIAAKGLNLVALCAGKKPAIIPITVENAIAANISHGGITETLVPSAKP